MTGAEAQRLQDEARAHGRWIMWFVAVSRGKARAWAIVANPHGGVRLRDELVADTLENLKVLLRTRWERERAQRSAPAQKPVARGAPRVYLICDQQDEPALEPLEDFFYEQGIEVSLPGFEAEESEVQQIHIQNLRDCDAALIYYGAAGMHWVDFKIRDLQKAAGYRD